MTYTNLLLGVYLSCRSSLFVQTLPKSFMASIIVYHDTITRATVGFHLL